MIKDNKIKPNEDSIPCELCESQSVYFKSKSSYDYFKCSKCNFVFLFPFLGDQELANLYSKSTYVSTKLEKKHKKLAKKIIILNAKNSLPQTLLDIGCQNGDFLNLISNSGNFQLFGVEASFASAQQAASNKKLIIKQGMFDKNLFMNQKFDLVNAGDLIEHLNDPINFLKQCKEVTSNYGLISISTPISNCTYVALNNLLNYYWPSYELAWLTPPYHVKYFSSHNLDLLMNKLGFEKIDCFYTGSNFWYEIIEAQFFNGFKSRKFLQKLNPKLYMKIAIFTLIYFTSKIFKFNRNFSYTAIYKKSN